MAGHRRSIRLAETNYAATGAYFVTICVHEKQCVFGTIVDGVMTINAWGQIVIEEWQRTSILRPTIGLGSFVVMPNHFHCIVIIKDGAEGAVHHVPTHTAPRSFGHLPANSLHSVVATFKAAVTRQIRRLDGGESFQWQRNYYEHIICDAADAERIQAYIETNPQRWQDDKLWMA